MNDNEQNFSNTPYKATRNLNTMIGNPDININSATASNIKEVGSEKNNNMNSSLFENNLDNLKDMDNSNLDYQGSRSALVEAEDNLDNDPIRDFINKTNNNSYKNTLNDTNSNESLSSNVALDSNASTSVGGVFSNSVDSNNTIDKKVKYENVYQTYNKKNKSKKTFSIPKEFRTAIFVVLILLIVLSYFESIYDFFRNLNIFG